MRLSSRFACCIVACKSLARRSHDPLEVSLAHAGYDIGSGRKPSLSIFFSENAGFGAAWKYSSHVFPLVSKSNICIIHYIISNEKKVPMRVGIPAAKILETIGNIIKLKF